MLSLKDKVEVRWVRAKWQTSESHTAALSHSRFPRQVLCYLSDQQFDNGHVLEVVDDAHERMATIRSEKVRGGGLC